MKKYLLVAILGWLLVACNMGKKTLPQDYFTQALSCIDQQNYQQARFYLDSVHLVFPQEVPARQRARDLADSIDYLESKRTVAFTDSVLKKLYAQVDSQMPFYQYEQKTKYEKYGKYVHKDLRYWRNTFATFLYAYILDNGQLAVQMHYRGDQKINIRCVEVFSKNVFNRYVGEHYSFYTDESWFERMTFDPKDSKKILNFISANKESRTVFARLVGRTDIDVPIYRHQIRALEDTYYLAQMMEDIKNMERQLQIGQRKIERYETKSLLPRP